MDYVTVIILAVVLTQTTKPVDQESGIDNVEGTQDGNYTDDLRMITYTEIP